MTKYDVLLKVSPVIFKIVLFIFNIALKVKIIEGWWQGFSSRILIKIKLFCRILKIKKIASRNLNAKIQK